MEIIVNDTNIFIDLYSCNLLDDFFMLPYNIHTTDFVMNELKEDEQRKVVTKFRNSGQLTIKSFDPQEILSIWEYYRMANKVCNLSIEDCSVLKYTKSLNGARLLTGDKTLRTRAEGEGIVVSGVLFIFDELVKHKIISPKEAVYHLKLLIEKNVRLPKDEIVKRFILWEDNLS